MRTFMYRCIRRFASISGLCIAALSTTSWLYRSDCLRLGVFTAMMRPVLAWCHRRGINSHACIDDWLLRNGLRQGVVSDTATVVALLRSLGLGINLPYSRLVPSQCFQFLGAFFGLRRFLVTPSEDRVLALGQCFRDFFDLPQVTMRRLGRLIGVMDSMADLVPLGRWRVRLLHWFRAVHWPRRVSYEDVVPPLPIWDRRLQWWMVPDNLPHGVPVHVPLPDRLLYTDASATRWGGQGALSLCQGRGLQPRRVSTSMFWSWKQFIWPSTHFG